MKKHIATAALFIICLTSSGQDARVILKLSYEKCQSVRNGYYDMTIFMKYMSEKDTVKSDFYCKFKKLKEDSLFSSAFHYYTFFRDTLRADVMYTGDDFVTAYSNDSTATVMAKSKWADEIESISHNFTFYSPLTNSKSKPLPQQSDYTDNKHIFRLVGEEKLNTSLCYHIQMNRITDTEDDEETLREEYHYWISKDDMIPLQFSVAFDVVMNNDTMYQYEKFVLNKYGINNLKDDDFLTLKSIPAHYKIKEYAPYKRLELLKKDTIAPAWELLSLTDEKVSLKSLQGKLVLIDFFYKSCYPCMQALPALQSLNEKYKDKGLRVIGIDPYDKKQDGIAAFLSKRGVTYTVLLGGKDVAKAYHVSAYPTMYLIDRKGNIIFVQEGYGKNVDEILEGIIKKNL